MNRVILIGNIGKDAETRTVGDFTVISFTLATTERYKDRNGEQQENTEWHQIEYWRKDGKLAEYLKKGTKVGVEGSIRTESWEKDGQKRFTTKIRANGVEFLGGGSKEQQSAPAPKEQKPAAANQERKPLYEMAEESLEPQEQDLPF